MTKSEKIRLYYGIFLGVLTVALGIAFIVTCATIYYYPLENGDIYTRERVGSRLLGLLAPILIWIAAIVAGFVLSVVFPDVPKRAGKRDDKSAFNRLQKRLPASGNEEYNALYAKYRKGERVRFIVRIVCALFCLAAAIACIVYLSTASNFHSLAELNSDILDMLRNVMPWVGVSFLLICAAAVFEVYYAKRTLPSVKKMIALGRGNAPYVSPFGKKRQAVVKVMEHKYVLLGLRIAALVLGLLFLILALAGFAKDGNGGIVDVLKKAINICTECIGLG